MKKIAETQNKSKDNTQPPQKDGMTGISWSSLTLGLGIMFLGSIYPFAFADKGEVNHGALMLFMWAMAAGLIRGVGFIPNNRILRIIASGYAAFIAFALALVLMFT